MCAWYDELGTSSCILELQLEPAYCTAATEGDDTRGCGDTIGPPEDEHRDARNMLRSVV